MSAHGWDVVDGRADQVDLSIDLGAGDSGGARRIGSIRHGERAVLRSHDTGRLLAGGHTWLQALVSEPPPLHLRTMNLAVLADGRTLVTPRWVTADSALMDRLLRGARWIDGAWVELRVTGSAIVCVDAEGTERRIDAIVLDEGGRELDVSTPARRAGALFGWIASPEPATSLDIASHLATTVPLWHATSTEDIPTACRSVAALLRR